jgi:hypothetical protein
LREKREKREEQRGRLADVHLVQWLWSRKRVCCTLICDSCVLAGGNREEPLYVNVVSEGIGLWGVGGWTGLWAGWLGLARLVDRTGMTASFFYYLFFPYVSRK